MLALSGPGPLKADDPDLSWNPGNGFPGTGSATFIVYPKILPQASSIVACDERGACGGESCYSLDDPRCSIPAREHGWLVYLAPQSCVEAATGEECIETLRVTTSDGVDRESRYTGLANFVQTFEPDPARGLPTGSVMSLWSDPSSPDGSTGYAVALGGTVRLPPEHQFSADDPIVLQRFGIQVWRYRYVPASQRPWYACLWNDSVGGQPQCAVQIPFEEGSRLEVGALVNSKLTGWLSGRLRDPRVQVTPVGPRLNRVTVSALPVDVPMVAGSVPMSTANEDIRRLWTDVYRCPEGCQVAVDSDSNWVPVYLKAFAGALGDRALKMIPTWTVSSVEGFPSECKGDVDSLVGLVTTNATGYDGGPPAYVNGALEYSVSALHKTPSGEVFTGTYDLLVRSETARCIYGFDDAPIRAEIQVFSEDGVEQVATTAVSESEGWLHLVATGFTFSNPRISVRLTTASPPIVVPSAVSALRAKPLRSAIRVSWAAPQDLGGAASVAYTFRAGNGPWTQTSSRSIRVTGQRGKPITVAVRAVNDAGPGPILRVTARPR